MTVFVDTGVFYAHHDESATRHDAARDALRTVLGSSEYGRAYTNEYVYDETVTLTRSRTGSVDAALAVGRRLRGAGEFPHAMTMLHTTEAVFASAVDVFETYRDQPLSFTDAATVATVEWHDVDAVLSFDDDFDGLVRRLDPGDVAAGAA